jgi:hypothetical protein
VTLQFIFLLYAPRKRLDISLSCSDIKYRFIKASCAELVRRNVVVLQSPFWSIVDVCPDRWLYDILIYKIFHEKYLKSVLLSRAGGFQNDTAKQHGEFLDSRCQW